MEYLYLRRPSQADLEVISKIQALHPNEYMVEIEPGLKKKLLSFKADEIVLLYSRIVADYIACSNHRYWPGETYYEHLSIRVN